jgi:hypothetical protein
MAQRPVDSKLAKFIGQASIPVLIVVALLALTVGTINAVLTAEVATVAGFSTVGTVVLTILAGGLSFAFAAVFGLFFSAVATFIGSIFYTLLFKKDETTSEASLPYGRNNPCWGLDPSRRPRVDDTEVVEVVEVVEEPVVKPVAVKDDSQTDGVGPVAEGLKDEKSGNEVKPADQPKS